MTKALSIGILIWAASVVLSTITESSGAGINVRSPKIDEEVWKVWKDWKTSAEDIYSSTSLILIVKGLFKKKSWPAEADQDFHIM